MKLRTVRSQCFLSNSLQCKDYYHAFYPLTCPTSKKLHRFRSSEQRATVTCLLFCHEKYSVNSAENGSQYELLQYITDKRYRFSHNQKGVQKMVSEYVLYISVNFESDKKIILVALIAHHTPTV